MLQNRINPLGEIISTTARGRWMGNRGLLHNPEQQIVRPFKLKAWITCLLSFKGRKRQVMAPGLYTELFMLDEATAFAAGHRPCAECRREDFNRFKQYWLAGNPQYGFDIKVPVHQIDEILHRERFYQGKKVTYPANVENLPGGTFVLYHEKPVLLWGGAGYPWTPFGYETPVTILPGTICEVLTPRSVVNAFRAGYRAQTAAAGALHS